MTHTSQNFWRKALSLILLVIFAVLGIFTLQRITACQGARNFTPTPPLSFDGQRAYQDIAHQLSLGPRSPGSEGHQAVIRWITQELKSSGWQVDQQSVQIDGNTVHNLIAHQGQLQPQIIFGAHYDTRLWADQDPDPALRRHPVPGANDGASGVAVLLEMARVMPPEERANTWLVFFDAEDQGRIEGQDWIRGSTAFVQHMQFIPQAVIIIDMIGDKNLDIYLEKNSDPALAAQVWEHAASLGYTQSFIPELRHSILDDHTPFVQAGISAIDIIDFDYPFWHTTHDTLDQVSAQSLQTVGDTLLAWLSSQNLP